MELARPSDNARGTASAEPRRDPSGQQPEAAPGDSATASKPYGKLPVEVIQSTVRAFFPHYRECYEAALGRNPKLRGRLAVGFVIERQGHVTQVNLAGSDLGDEVMHQCVLAHFQSLVFPPPDGGIVTVVYPISFAPDP